MTIQLYRRAQQLFVVLCFATTAGAQLTPADATFAGLSARTAMMAYQAAHGDMTVVGALMADATMPDRTKAYRSLTRALVLMDSTAWTPESELTTGVDFALGSKLIAVGEDLPVRVVFQFDAPPVGDAAFRMELVDEGLSFALEHVAGRKTGEKIEFTIPRAKLAKPGVHLIHARLLNSAGKSLYDYYRTVVVIPDLNARTAALESALASLPDKDSRAAVSAQQVLETIQQAHRSYYVAGFQALTGFVFTRMRAVNLGAAEAIDYDTALKSATGLAATLKAGKDPFASATGELAMAYKSAFDGKLVPYRVFVPSNYDKSKKYPLMVMLHGAGGNETDFMDGYRKQFPVFAEKRGYIIAAVNGRGPLSGYTKESGGEQDVLDVADLMKKNYNIDPARVYLGGHSMGGAGTWRVGLLYADRWAGLIPIAGSSPASLPGYQAQLNSPRKLPVMMVCGVKDALVAIAGCRTLAEKTKAIDAPLKYSEYADGDHLSVVAMSVPDIFDWLDQQGKR